MIYLATFERNIKYQTSILAKGFANLAFFNMPVVVKSFSSYKLNTSIFFQILRDRVNSVLSAQ